MRCTRGGKNRASRLCCLPLRNSSQWRKPLCALLMSPGLVFTVLWHACCRCKEHPASAACAVINWRKSITVKDGSKKYPLSEVRRPGMLFLGSVVSLAPLPLLPVRAQEAMKAKPPKPGIDEIYEMRSAWCSGADHPEGSGERHEQASRRGTLEPCKVLETMKMKREKSENL